MPKHCVYKVLCLVFFISKLCFAGVSDRSYRNFWHPYYHGERLNYCMLDGTECGKKVATCFCQIMGYSYAKQYIPAHNIGITNYLTSRFHCKGWRCNGFKMIQCVKDPKHIKPKSYHYRFRRFVFPRFEHYRVAWCFDGIGHCGKRAAFSFCRRMGYLGTKRFAIQKHVPATKAIANQRLCFGKSCTAFAYIDCFR